MSSLIVDGVSKSFGSVRAVERVSLEVSDGKRLVLLGPSGCGKTTILRIIAGLERPDSGKVAMGDRDWRDVSPAARNVAMVFQTPTLYPLMRVRENLAFALQGQRIDRREIATRIDEVARWMGIAELLDRYPATLSGGQQSRAAFARAIVKRPSLLLLDEPLGGLDTPLRWELQNEWLQWHRRFPVTTVHVTHDQREAMILADQIAVMRDGKMVQTGTPQELYERPVDRFVAGFFGSPGMNCATARIAQGWVQCGGVKLLKSDAMDLSNRDDSDSDVTIGVRPESICIEPMPIAAGRADASESDDDRVVLSAKVFELRLLGYQWLVGVAWQENRWWILRGDASGIEPGGDVRVRFLRTDIRCFFD